MSSKLLLFLCLIFGLQWQMFSQEDAWVYFSDKQNVATSLENPTTILSQKAVDRKARFGIPIDERDVPVNEAYITQLKQQDGILVLAKSKWFNAVHVRGSQTAIKDLEEFSFVSEISFADKNLNTTSRVNRESFSELASKSDFVYGSASNQVEMIQINTLHEQNFTGTGLTIAVLDSGFPNVNTVGAFQYLIENNKLLGSYNFLERHVNVYDENEGEHGTWVLSTMAGYIENEYVGTAPDASYYLFMTENGISENPVEESLWVEAAERADSLGVDIINSSLGYKYYDNPNYSYQHSDLDGKTAYVTKGAAIASEKGILVVTSAGNSDTDGVGAPADAEGVFSIGAVDANGNYAYFSSQGSDIQPSLKPDVSAQGLGTAVVSKTNTIQKLNGTSFSSPIMAGAMACLWQAFPDLTNLELMELVRAAGSQYRTPDNLLGYGIPNFATALENGNLTVGNHTKDLQVVVYPNPTSQNLYFKTTSETPEITVSVFDVLGHLVLEKTMSNQHVLDVSTLEEGMYMLRITSLNRSLTKKIIKLHGK
ncbi:S8 family serine peptidase [Formosa haliotis]|uniref:S8 family serine peptidase n=1 Tax=Formosa haliotis TaxID=1555194 RepID=UPI000825DC26|nr:S8 family serine peptidase [Formosa haliotis]